MIHERFVERPGHEAPLHGDVRMPEGPPPRSAVVVVHGFKGFKDWGFFPWLCGRLAAAGHAVVSFNFSGSGIGSDPERFTELEAFARNTYSRERGDLAWIVRRLREGALTGRPPDRVGILGHSRGGGTTVIHAASDPDLDALVTWSSVSTFDRWDEARKAEWREAGRISVLNARTGQKMPLDVGLLDDLERNRGSLDVEAAAGRVGAPWLIVHGREDRSVNAEEAHSLVRANPAARLHLVDGAGHTFEVGHPFEGPSPELEEAADVTERHFERHLGGR